MSDIAGRSSAPDDETSRYRRPADGGFEAAGTAPLAGEPAPVRPIEPAPAEPLEPWRGESPQTSLADDTPPPSLDLAGGRRAWIDLQRAVAHAVVGGENALLMTTVALLADGHALLEDVPGIGKTLLARAFARALGLASARIQGTPDLLPVDVTGSSILQDGAFRFVPGPVFTNVLLVDEINRATPRTQSALLEAMQERQVSIEGTTRPLPDPFLLLATQNPIEYEGTFALPEAQLDRFLVRISLGYPDEQQERLIARRYQAARDPLADVPAVLDGPTVSRLRDEVRQVRVADEVEAYVTSLVRATRHHPDVSVGASPRASVALYRCGQAFAFLNGRDFVRPDDVKAMALPVLAHRLVIDLDRSMHGATSAEVVKSVLTTVVAPPAVG